MILSNKIHTRTSKDGIEKERSECKVLMNFQVD